VNDEQKKIFLYADNAERKDAMAAAGRQMIVDGYELVEAYLRRTGRADLIDRLYLSRDRRALCREELDDYMITNVRALSAAVREGNRKMSVKRAEPCMRRAQHHFENLRAGGPHRG
jgi:hypothetical protein